LFHIIAGILTITFVLSGEPVSAIAGIADASDPSMLQLDYPKAVVAILGQHGFNLVWIGLVTFISGLYIWKGKSQAIFIAALIGGLADLGYFLFLDLGGYVNFLPATLMTLISGAAIVSSFYTYYVGIKKA
jgi:hypothetical protein